MSPIPHDLQHLCYCERCGQAFTATEPAKRCRVCRYMDRSGKSRPARWRRTPEREAVLRARYDSRVRGRVGEIAQAIGFPRWAVTRWAAELGLTRPTTGSRKPWTSAELALLEHEASRRTVTWLSRKLRRTVSSVVNKLKHEAISRIARDHFTMRDLELCLGIDHRVIVHWIERGWLRASRRGTASTHDAWVITRPAVRAFLRAHPLAFDLRRVDQLWFVDFALGVVVEDPETADQATTRAA